VYAESETEAKAVTALSQEIAGGLLTADSVVTLACYRLVGREPFAQTLRSCPELAGIASVVARQVTEPAEEAALAAALPCLAPVEDSVSLEVRAQYEENPYPRWCKAGLPPPLPFARAVRELFPGMRFDAAIEVASPRILVAGCGTGKHAVLTACRYAGARVTAVDLSQHRVPARRHPRPRWSRIPFRSRRELRRAAPSARPDGWLARARGSRPSGRADDDRPLQRDRAVARGRSAATDRGARLPGDVGRHSAFSR
jgi:hypothetical protein